MSIDNSILPVDDISVHFTDNGGSLGLFGERQTARAANDISPDIGENDVVTPIDESGCGKSTLEKAIVGMREPIRGSITYRGQDTWEARDSRDPDIPFSGIRWSLQIIHQGPGSALNPSRHILTSLMLPLKKWNPSLDEEEHRERIYTLLERVGLMPVEDFIKRFPHQLSDDEKQRVVLVRPLLLNPDVILTDKVISTLDVNLRVETMDLMFRLQDLFNTSHIFISHDLSNTRYTAEESGDRIAVMYLNRIVEVGPIGQAIDDPQHSYTQALKWVTPNLYEGNEDDDLPIRRIDIPDPTGRPDGCHFHPRCPKVHEVCEMNGPGVFEDETDHIVQYFYADKDHEHWDSPSIVGD